MHELPVITEILKVVLEHAARHRLRRVTAVHLEVGALSELEDEWLQRYFDHLSRGGRAAGARLLLKRVPATLTCADCGAEFAFDGGAQARNYCPACAGHHCRLLRGQGYFIKNLEGI
ncbi:MAG TPA: hydrogenase maturation nickel metallochaperone HypA [Proteobacteria bacterium]|nr:hydrogenase maturation nickel metallochaperone HypA [Pseudomonadota bacterium]